MFYTLYDIRFYKYLFLMSYISLLYLESLQTIRVGIAIALLIYLVRQYNEREIQKAIILGISSLFFIKV